MPSIFSFTDRFRGNTAHGDFTMGIAIENTGNKSFPYAVSQLYGYTKRGETRWFKKKYTGSYPDKMFASDAVNAWKGRYGMEHLNPTRHQKIIIRDKGFSQTAHLNLNVDD